MVAAIRRVARTVPGADVIVATCTSAHNNTKTGKPDIAWDDVDARAALIHGLVTDALAVLRALTAPGAEPIDQDSTAGRAVALLALIAGQDVEWITDPDDANGGGRWRIARKVAEDRVISTVDPETRHAHKTRQHRQDGFKGHLICEPDTGIITGAKLTQASGAGSHDASVGAELLDADHSINGAAQVLGDSAYGTGDMVAKLEADGHTNAVKPWPVRQNMPDGFTTDDFTVDHDAHTVTCPAGHTVGFTLATRTAKFRDLCAGCPLALCTNASQGRTVKTRDPRPGAAGAPQTLGHRPAAARRRSGTRYAGVWIAASLIGGSAGHHPVTSPRVDLSARSCSTTASRIRTPRRAHRQPPTRRHPLFSTLLGPRSGCEKGSRKRTWCVPRRPERLARTTGFSGSTTSNNNITTRSGPSTQRRHQPRIFAHRSAPRSGRPTLTQEESHWQRYATWQLLGRPRRSVFANERPQGSDLQTVDKSLRKTYRGS